MSLSQQLFADIDGDGHNEIISFFSDSSTVVYRNPNDAIWRSANWIDGWNRRPWDQAIAARLFNNGCEQIFITNNRDNWTGVLAWTNGGLHVAWAGPSPVQGPAGAWNRRSNDSFHATPYEGHEAISVTHPAPDEWHGVFAWNGSQLATVTLTQATSGQLPVTFRPSANAPQSAICSGDLADGELAPAGALIRSVKNMTIPFPNAYPSTVSVSLSVNGSPGVSLGGWGGSSDDTTYALSGLPVAGHWQAILGGTNIPVDSNRQASFSVNWYLP